MYAIDAAFDGNPDTLQESLSRLRDKIRRTTSIAIEQDSETNNAYNDFIAGFGSVNAGFGIDGSVATHFENDNLEAGLYGDFISGFSGNANPHTVAPSAAEALDSFEDGLE